MGAALSSEAWQCFAPHTGVQGDHGFGLWNHHPDEPLSIASTLDGPDHQIDLVRTSIAADGKSCQVHGDGDQDVSLSLLPLNDQVAQSELGPIEAAPSAIAPPRSAPSMVNVNAGDGPCNHDSAKVDLPGLHVDGNGNSADNSVLGVHIKADGDIADLHKDVGMKGASLHARPAGADIRAADIGQNAADLLFILAGDARGPSGYRTAGCIARGPSKGPLFVGASKSRQNRGVGQDHDL